MKPYVWLSLITLLGWGMTAPSSDAQTPVPMAPDELAATRGGVLLPGNVLLDFGAVVRTYVNGDLAMESRLTWTEAGVVVRRTDGLPGGVDLAASLSAALAGGLDLEALRGGEGLLLSDTAGTTALIHDFRSGGVQNIILNNANGRDLRQEIEITLGIPELGAMQRDIGIARAGAQMGQDISAAGLRSLSW